MDEKLFYIKIEFADEPQQNSTELRSYDETLARVDNAFRPAIAVLDVHDKLDYVSVNKLLHVEITRVK